MKTRKLTPIPPDQLILHLIQNDILNGKLIYGLARMHIHAEDYHLTLSELVFQLLGYDPQQVPEEVSDRYFELVRQAALGASDEKENDSKAWAKRICEEIGRFL